MSTKNDASKTEEEMLDALRKTVADAEGLLKEATKETGKKAEEIRMKVKDLLSNAQSAFEEGKQKVVDTTRDAVKKTDDYVQDNPWRAVGTVGVAALLLGIIIGRK
ncbi:putative membrane protein [Taylorella asinigenitalis 14/45]|uniref:ElaB like protein n=2 Tax=Taylorella asinigenitalis TaxID=84590 RepID=G4QCA9_TAYAM|nr:DUF883 family protein [Taylorella asinigenitalis]AEP37078.1 ElaB like protein [Taylorella asinigenitalis MCE3]CCG19838.1 putative membrane protein [Taylorella asinigenitalis 14/45]